jgi:TonB family protein
MSKLSVLSAIACAFLAFAPGASAEDAPPKSDGDLIPIKRVEPQFPMQALRNGISGFVRVVGTVGPDGSVVEVHVVESKPPGVFDDSTLRAVKKWLYKPRIVDGVAVSRPFEQTIDYNLSSGSPQEDALWMLAHAHRDDALTMFARMRATCPDRYSHADDAANAALRLRLKTDKFRDGPWIVEPEQQASADAALIREVEPCLFSSWEQLRDAEVFAIAGQMLSYQGQVDSIDIARAMRAVSAQMQATPGTAATDPAQVLVVRAWLFRRLIPAYYGLINAQAAQFPEAHPKSPATSDALDRAKAAVGRLQPKEARSILNKALKETVEGVDRGLLLLALSRIQAGLGDTDDALESLRMVIAIERVPWNLLLTAEMARATLCGRIGDAACFEGSRSKLNAELGVTEKFAF